MKSMCWTRAVLDYVGLLFVQNYLYQIIWLSAILPFRFGLSDLQSSRLLRTYVPDVLTHTRRTNQNLAFLRRSLTTSFILGSRVASLSKAPHGCNAFLLTIRQADYTLKGPPPLIRLDGHLAYKRSCRTGVVPRSKKPEPTSPKGDRWSALS